MVVKKVAKKVAKLATAATKTAAKSVKKVMRGGSSMDGGRPSICPPGVFCIENYTFWIVGLMAVIVGLYFYFTMDFTRPSQILQITRELRGGPIAGGAGGDILSNPYIPPERPPPTYGRYQTYDGGISPDRLININTRSGGYEESYRQVGIITREDEESDSPTIMPIFGKPSATNRDKWNYYTMSSGFNSFKIPLSYKDRNCLDDNGCEEIYSKDKVYIPQYKSFFNVDVYNLDRPKYIPNVL